MIGKRTTRIVGTLVLVLGIMLMHALGSPNMSHDGVPGLGVAAHSMGGMKVPGPTPSHSDGVAMAGIGCAYAVLVLSSLATRRTATKGRPRPTAALRLPIGPLRGPEPPVPRFV